jgi:hypothetical protein
MIRRWGNVLGAAWLIAAAAQAPWSHVHPQDPDHSHATGFAHGHFGGVHHQDIPGEVEIEPHDDDEAAIWPEWTPAAAQRVAVTYAEAPAGPVWKPGNASAGAAPEFRPRSHDPPAGRPSSARAPPL